MKRYRLKRVLLLGLLALGALCGCMLSATPVWAGAFGEIAQVGSFGIAEGKFQWPIDVAADPSDNSVYVVDTEQPGVRFPGAGPTSFRVQKFSSSLAAKPLATATIATLQVGGEKQTVAGIVVDSSLHRLYVLKAIETSQSGSYEYVGGEIEVFSTVESGGALPSEGVFYKFPAPPTSLPAVEGTLGVPHGLAVDPTTHDLILLGSDENGNTLVQRVHAEGPTFTSGALANSFDDLTEAVDISSESATGVAVGPDGSIYLLSAKAAGRGGPGVVKLSSDFKAASILHIDETEPIFLTAGKFEASRDTGPQIAISPDGKDVYAAQTNEAELSGEPDTPGSYEVRGMSTGDGSQQIIFGGAETKSTTCLIASSYNAIAAGSGGVVYVLDEGNVQLPTENEGHTAFGFHLIAFGPGGSGCPEPSTSFSIDENTEATETFKVEKGADVKLLASTSNLKGGEPEELDWKIEGPEPAAAAESAGCPAACLSLKHWFLRPGNYTLTLDMKVTHSPFGPPPPVTRNIDVSAPLPTASFEASSSSAKPGEPVTFNGEGSLDPAGSCAPEMGCSPTSHLKSYTWSFGDGQTAATTNQSYTRTFANPSAEARSETVTLTVTNEEGVQSTPTTQTLTIQGGGATTGGQTTGGGTTPTNIMPGSQMPGGISGTVKPKALTNAQKLANALRACSKIKRKKSRASCKRLAKRRYGPKSKSKKHGGRGHK